MLLIKRRWVSVVIVPVVVETTAEDYEAALRHATVLTEDARFQLGVELRERGELMDVRFGACLGHGRAEVLPGASATPPTFLTKFQEGGWPHGTDK
jgi:hypothetical protein